MIYILDACAMLAFLDGEPGADIVELALLDPDNQCLAHAINLCEVFYGFYRVGGQIEAQRVINDLTAVGVVERPDLDSTFWQDAGTIKADHRHVSLADCCAIALTKRVGGTLLTSDHHELDTLVALGVCPITFIR